MDMKNTTILLIFLLCIIGLIIGVCYTEASESAESQNTPKEVIHIAPNGEITIQLEPIQKEEPNLINQFIS